MVPKALKKFIFLDRDGVINKYPGHGQYVDSLRNFKIIKSSLAGIKILSQAGYQLAVISNQSGISKKLYSRKTLAEITHFMATAIKKAGGRINKFCYCPHGPGDRCHCRKPQVGLLRLATKRSQINKKESYFIGDNLIDIQTGKNFHLKTILVLSGREKISEASQWSIQPDFIAKNLLSAAKNILAGRYERA